MLKTERAKRGRICFFPIFRLLRCLIKSHPKRITAAKSILMLVKKIGGLFSRAIFPREKMLDQAPYIKITRRIDMIGVFPKLMLLENVIR